VDEETKKQYDRPASFFVHIINIYKLTQCF